MSHDVFRFAADIFSELSHSGTSAVKELVFTEELTDYRDVLFSMLSLSTAPGCLTISIRPPEGADSIIDAATAGASSVYMLLLIPPVLFRCFDIA